VLEVRAALRLVEAEGFAMMAPQMGPPVRTRV
jgi:hypothetical protein